MFLSIHMVSNPMTDTEKKVCSVPTSAALMRCDTASCQCCYTLQQLFMLCFKYTLTAQSETNSKEEKHNTASRNTLGQLTSNNHLSLIYLHLVKKKTKLYNCFVSYFLNFLLFPLLSLPRECLQVLPISSLQFVALQITLYQYSLFFPKQILSQLELEWLRCSVSACSCENLAYCNFFYCLVCGHLAVSALPDVVCQLDLKTVTEQSSGYTGKLISFSVVRLQSLSC